MECWSAPKTLMNQQFRLDMPSNLKIMCEQNNIFSFIDKVEEIAQSVIVLMKDVSKIMFKTASQWRKVSTNFYQILKEMYLPGVVVEQYKLEIVNLRTISILNLVSPSIQEFDLEEINSLPNGVLFLKIFLSNPRNYLKSNDPIDQNASLDVFSKTF